MTNWKAIPDKKHTGEPIASVEWEGPGWYCTTRAFPGSEIYSTWRIPDDQAGLDDQQERDRASRSYGGPVNYYSEQPTS